MQYKCTICGETFEDDGDAMMHVGFGHALIKTIPETAKEAEDLKTAKRMADKSDGMI